MNKKLRGLLLQVEVMEGSEIKVLDENTFEVDGAEYLVLTEDEREKEFYDYQESLIEDMGLDAFSGWAQDYIIDNFVDDEWFMETMREHFEYYISDINEEPADNEKFESRLKQEIFESDCEDEEDYLENIPENILVFPCFFAACIAASGTDVIFLLDNSFSTTGTFTFLVVISGSYPNSFNIA